MDDLYESGGGEGEAPEKKPDTDKGEITALLPKSILAGKTFNVGDEVVLKITGIHEDQVSVAYADEKPDKGEAPAEEPAPEMAGGGGEDQSLFS